MLEFAYATGMRVSEIISLNIEDINLKEGLVICKMEEDKEIYLLEHFSLKALAEYIENSRPILIKDDAVKSIICKYKWKKTNTSRILENCKIL